MKRIITICAALLMTASVFLPQQASAQSPEIMSYQAVIRNNSDFLVTNTEVGMRISILQGAIDGTEVYKEIYNPNPVTNINGLVSIKIGAGIPIIGVFSEIDWTDGPYFIKTETDPAGGTSYSITGTSQLLSVPYALHSKTAETVTGGITETDPVFTAWDKSTGISITESQITDLKDYATKAYVDESMPATYEIGDLAHGGIVFFVEPCGTKGLVAAPEDQSVAIKWKGGSTDYNTMARGDKIYAGKMNTSIIISVHSAKDDFDDHAALIAANYTGDDFGDWYLPSREELILMYLNLHTQGLGGFALWWYWSSSEGSATNAWLVDFDSGTAYNYTKTNIIYVRAVRAF